MGVVAVVDVGGRKDPSSEESVGRTADSRQPWPGVGTGCLFGKSEPGVRVVICIRWAHRVRLRPAPHSIFASQCRCFPFSSASSLFFVINLYSLNFEIDSNSIKIACGSRFIGICSRVLVIKVRRRWFDDYGI